MPPVNVNDEITEQRAQSMLQDMKMLEHISKTMSRRFSLPELPGPTSLNVSRRKDDLQRITSANLKLLSRIESAKSEYSATTMRARNTQNIRYSLNSSYSLRKKCEKIASDVNKRNGM